ncbi:MAG: MbnP family protein [Cytophagaceae bacterium]
MKNFIVQLSILLSLSLAITSCKDNKNEDPAPVATGTIHLEFDHMFDGEEFVLDNSKYYFKTAYGDSIGISTFRYYISNIKFKKADGTTFTEQESYHLIDLDPSNLTTGIDVSGIPVGDYVTVEFMVGVDSTRNVSGAQSGALATTNGMFWSWNSGYIFLKCEGNYKTEDEVTSGSFVYHVGGFSGTNKALQTITLNVPSPAYARVANNAVSKMHLHINVEQLFNDPTEININTMSTIHMPGANAKTLSENYKGMFELDHVHN